MANTMNKISKNSEFKCTEGGFIPKEWKMLKIENILSLEYGRGLIAKNRKGNKYPVYGSNGIVGYNYEYLIKGPGIIVGRKGTIGSVKWSNIDYWPIDTTYYVKLKETEIDLEWLSNKLLTLGLSKLNMATGTPGLNRDLVYNLNVSIPPLQEQKKIAEILSTIDHSIDEVDESIITTGKLKKGLIQGLFTKGIGHKEFKEAEIGKIPKEWEIVEMKDIADINKEHVDPARELPNKNFFYIDIDSVENETGVIKNLREIIGREAPLRARRQIRYNDVIMSTVRPYLKAFAIIPKLYDGQICSTGFAVLSCKEKVLPRFLLYILFSKSLVSQFNREMVGAQYPALNSSQVKKLKISLPSISEQEKIAEILSAVDERIQLLKEKKKKLERVKKGLMNDLLIGRKRVKI